MADKFELHGKAASELLRSLAGREVSREAPAGSGDATPSEAAVVDSAWGLGVEQEAADMSRVPTEAMHEDSDEIEGEFRRIRGGPWRSRSSDLARPQASVHAAHRMCTIGFDVHNSFAHR